MAWIVYFVFIGFDLHLPPGITATFHAGFPTAESCQQWVEEVGKQVPAKIRPTSECAPNFPTVEQQNEFFDGLKKGLDKSFPKAPS